MTLCILGAAIGIWVMGLEVSFTAILGNSQSNGYISQKWYYHARLRRGIKNKKQRIGI